MKIISADMILFYKKSFLSKKWKNYFFSLSSDGFITRYKDQDEEREEACIDLKQTSILVGDDVIGLDDRPPLDLWMDGYLLMRIPESNRSCWWLMFTNYSQMGDWMENISLILKANQVQKDFILKNRLCTSTQDEFCNLKHLLKYRNEAQQIPPYSINVPPVVCPPTRVYDYDSIFRDQNDSTIHTERVNVNRNDDNSNAGRSNYYREDINNNNVNNSYAGRSNYDREYFDNGNVNNMSNYSNQRRGDKSNKDITVITKTSYSNGERRNSSSRSTSPVRRHPSTEKIHIRVEHSPNIINNKKRDSIRVTAAVDDSEIPIQKSNSFKGSHEKIDYYKGILKNSSSSSTSRSNVKFATTEGNKVHYINESNRRHF